MNRSALAMMSFALTLCACVPDKVDEVEFQSAKATQDSSTSTDASVDSSPAQDVQALDVPQDGVASTDVNAADTAVVDTAKADTAVKDAGMTDTSPPKDTNTINDTGSTTDTSSADTSKTDAGVLDGGVTKTCDLNTWVGCGKGEACHLGLGALTPKCVAYGGAALGKECNPFTAMPQCGRSGAGVPMRCHPVLRRCAEICGPGAPCKTGICDKLKPWPKYPADTGQCLRSCEGKCKESGNTSLVCACGADCVGEGTCCSNFQETCASIKPSKKCSIWNNMGCDAQQVCVPKLVTNAAGVPDWVPTCVASGKQQAGQSCKMIPPGGQCAVSELYGTQVCGNGTCVNVCRVGKSFDCLPGKNCVALDPTGKNFPASYGACL